MLHKPDTHTERLLKLADFLDDLEPHRFSMKQWGNIREPRCICGWLQHTRGLMEKDDWASAADYLGLDVTTAVRLFQQPFGDPITNEQAARALRHYAVTGEFKGW